MDEEQKFPQHIAIIMDGNGRWATARGLPRVMGHQAGAQAVQRVVEACCELGIKALTLYAFSWENRDRPPDEIHELMTLLDQFIRSQTPRLLANGIRLRAIGRLQELPQSVVGNLRRVIDQTRRGERMTLILALSYGGREEIVDAAGRLAELGRQGKLQPEQIDESRLAQQLYAPDLPDPDLLIRTSGEQRLSNFLLWQSSYTELYVTPKLWPDFSKDDLMEAMLEYERRERRFGRVAAMPAADPASPSPSDGRQVGG